MTKISLKGRVAWRVSVVVLAWGCLATVGWAKKQDAKDIAFFFTGQSYASFYPCHCPGVPRGGVARRATAVKAARAAEPGLLVVEAGVIFGSGPQDPSATNLELDRERTKVYLRALKAMGYDALLVSGQEFVFGAPFLKDLKDHPFVSSNVEGVGRPVIVKDVNGVRVGVLGWTDETATSRDAIAWKAPVTGLADKVKDLKRRGVDVVVVLSSLKPEDDARLLAGAPGIDVVINGSASYTSVNPKEVEGALVLSTWWQARKAGLLKLRVEGGAVRLVSCESVDLGPDVADDPDVAALLPACIQDSDCAPREGLMARCERPGDLSSSRCVYTQPSMLDVTVIAPKECRSCQTQAVLRDLEALFGKMRVRALDAADPQAQKMIDEIKASALPIYVFGPKAEQHELFPSLSAIVDKKGPYYVVKPGVAGVSFLVKRPRISGRLDVFFDLSYPSLAQLMRRLKEFGAKHKDVTVELHFLAAQDEVGAFMAPGGLPVIEEYKRMACLEAAYPEGIHDYLICRAATLNSGLWERCAQEIGADVASVRGCAEGPEGDKALEKKIAVTRELEVAKGPVLLVDNQEVYGMVDVPSLEELERRMGLTQKENENK